ncbi:MAG: hypothetical protein E7171_06855 [Firmicutes bacterium]|nr:hypothetical protein [Bacillota bacterium]
MNNYLLSDETFITEEDLRIRRQLYYKFMELPKEFVSKMRHLQPQIGCFNNCGFCSKFSVCKSEYWNEVSLRNVISALKRTAQNYTDGDLLLAWDRKEHRVGVLFPYLNNDVGAYEYLDKYVDLCYKELGARTRISTVGYSRHNKVLNEVHKKINASELLFALAGVRLSITQYGRVWEEDNGKNSLEDYRKDLANFLSIYRPYFDKFGSGSRKMCCELRYNPLAVNAKVIETEVDGKMVIATGNYLFISKEKNVTFKVAYISDPYVHALEISEEPAMFSEYNLPFEITSEKELVEFIKTQELYYEKDVEVYKFQNKDGYYYAINPKITNKGNYGFNIYPETDVRKKSGYLVTERFLLNAFYKFKKEHGLHLREKYSNSTWDDVEKVITLVEEQINYYESKGKIDKAEYINKHILPIVRVYVDALREANYPSDCFFDSKFTIDTGMICNLGRAIGYFKGLTKFVNEPLTPTHERNYGRHCSTMKQESYVWMLGCGFNNKINIERLDLFKTASEEGQTSYKETIEIDGFNQKVDDKIKYLYPGIRE